MVLVSELGMALVCVLVVSRVLVCVMVLVCVVVLVLAYTSCVVYWHGYGVRVLGTCDCVGYGMTCGDGMRIGASHCSGKRTGTGIGI